MHLPWLMPTLLLFPGLSVQGIHGGLGHLGLQHAAVGGRLMHGMGPAGNSVLLVSNLNPEVGAIIRNCNVSILSHVIL